jgi:predicted transcriptional regulator
MQTRSQNEKLIEFFKSGKEITESEAKTRFGIERFSARIQELRAEGYSIYRNTKKSANGQPVNHYRLGKPTRKMISAAYHSLGASAFA